MEVPVDVVVVTRAMASKVRRMNVIATPIPKKMSCKTIATNVRVFAVLASLSSISFRNLKNLYNHS